MQPAIGGGRVSVPFDDDVKACAEQEAAQKSQEIEGLLQQNRELVAKAKQLHQAVEQQQQAVEEAKQLQAVEDSQQQQHRHSCQSNRSSVVVTVSEENLENAEVALGPRNANAKKNRGLDVTHSCDCYLRIQELEELLRESRSLYEEAEERMRADKERKARMMREAEKQLVKTKAVLKTTSATVAPLKEKNK